MSFFASVVTLIALFCLVATLIASGFFNRDLILSGTLQSYIKFAYGSFFKPHSGDGSGNQQDALESFYEYQADAYDTTRTRLLRGRDDMIRLVAAQLKYKQFDNRPVWVDIGGGTGWNIEQMGKHVHVPSFFSTVYLVDLTPSLLKIAQARFKKLGWDNIKVVCMDCRYFSLKDLETTPGHEKEKADLITMSYSLTMIPDFFPVIDMATSLLASTGIIGIVDFYAQTEVEFMRRDYVGGFLDRHCTWLNRTFWRTWFEQDRVMFDGGRRDYLEYRFGTRLSVNKRNAMFSGLRIPFYIWVGCNKYNSSAQLDVSVVQTSFSPAPEGFKRPEVPLPSVYYLHQPWRTYYRDSVDPPQQEKPRSATPTANDFANALDILSIQHDDVILVPTGLGDTVFSIILRKPQSVHAVDFDATQNHLLELKTAAFQTLDRSEWQHLFRHSISSSFRDLLIEKISPCLSSQALQYWLNYGSKGWLSGNNPNPDLIVSEMSGSDQHDELSSPGAFDGLRIHTADMNDVLDRTSSGSVTIFIAGETLDFPSLEAESQIRALSRVLAVKGRVLLELTADEPWHITSFQKLGFEVQRPRSKYLVYTKIRSLE